MAFNPYPEVSAARDIADRFHKDKVIIFMIENATQTIEYVSYGKTPNDSKEAKRVADRLWDAFPTT